MHREIEDERSSIYKDIFRQALGFSEHTENTELEVQIMDHLGNYTLDPLKAVRRWIVDRAMDGAYDLLVSLAQAGA